MTSHPSTLDASGSNGFANSSKPQLLLRRPRPPPPPAASVDKSTTGQHKVNKTKSVSNVNPKFIRYDEYLTESDDECDVNVVVRKDLQSAAISESNSGFVRAPRPTPEAVYRRDSGVQRYASSRRQIVPTGCNTSVVGKEHTSEIVQLHTVQLPHSLTGVSVRQPDRGESTRRHSSFSEFVTKLSEKENLPIDAVKTVMYSRHNYIKIQKLLADQSLCSHQQSLNVIDLYLPSALNVPSRVPLRQLLIELVQLIKEQISEVTGKRIKSVLQVLPRFHAESRFSDLATEGKETRIEFYEDDDDESFGASQSRLSRFHDRESSGKATRIDTGNTRFYQSPSQSRLQSKFYDMERTDNENEISASNISFAQTALRSQLSKLRDMDAGDKDSGVFTGNTRFLQNTSQPQLSTHHGLETAEKESESTTNNTRIRKSALGTPLSSFQDLETMEKENRVLSDYTRLRQSASQSRLSRFLDSETPGKESVLSSSKKRFFQGSQRSSSPFQLPDSEVISPAEIAVLDSLVNRGRKLNLKAYFLSNLPDVGQVISSLNYVNLSYNNFTQIPREVLNMENLTTLKFRNNPLITIHPLLSTIKHLHSLVLSYCLIEFLPKEFFLLENLQLLNLSYNKLMSLPNELSQLAKLRDFTVEGNRLPGLPVGALKLRCLKFLCVTNNFMHPVFWPDNCRNQPQRLRDLCRLSVKNRNLDHLLPQKEADTLSRACNSCDCCGGFRFGKGLCTIRPVQQLCGVRNVPIIFRSCSVTCLKSFRFKQSELRDMIYGNVTKTS